MKAQTITATQLKARLLSVLDDVASSGRELIVTKRGKPVARLVPPEPVPSLSGSVTYLVGEDELLAPLAEIWDASGG